MLPAHRTTAATRAWAILAACAVACVAEPDQIVEPGDSLLTGEYGGDGIGIVATATQARFEFRCADGHTGPLRLDSGGAARASGTYLPVWAGGRPRDLEVEARLRWPGILDLTVRIGDGPSLSFVALLDAPPDVAARCLLGAAS